MKDLLRIVMDIYLEIVHENLLYKYLCLSYYCKELW